jgi:hypothetical protein
MFNDNARDSAALDAYLTCNEFDVTALHVEATCPHCNPPPTTSPTADGMLPLDRCLIDVTRANKRWIRERLGLPAGKPKMLPTVRKCRADDLDEQRKDRAEQKREVERIRREGRADKREQARFARRVKRSQESDTTPVVAVTAPPETVTPADRERRARRRYEKHVTRQGLVRVLRAKKGAKP